MGKRTKGNSVKGKAVKRGKGSGGAAKPVSGHARRQRKAGPGGSGGGSEAPVGNRRQQRQEWRDAQKADRQQRRGHDDHESLSGARQRLTTKLLEKRLAKLPADAPTSERCEMLRELGRAYAEGRRTRQAIETFQSALELSPEDPEFIRTPLLCLLMDAAQTEGAKNLVTGSLFASTGEQSTLDACSPDSVAATTGGYSLALLTYLSVRVVEDYKGKPKAAAAAEVRLAKRMRAARTQNPFVAEYLAFAPAFEPHFPVGAELPTPAECTAVELPLREALEYCCRYRQASVWIDTDEHVRKFLRVTVFEEEEGGEASTKEKDGEDNVEEESALGKLPPPEPKETPILSRWRRAREEALELWASEMSVDGGSEAGEGEEEEEGSESEDSEDAVAKDEEGMGFG